MIRVSLATAGLALTSLQYASAVVVIQDDFNAGTVTTGATVLPNTNWATGGNTPTESGGNLVLYTGTGASQYKTSSIYTSVAPSSLNLFQQTITMSVRGLTLSGEGDAIGGNSRFRMGLIPRSNEAYSAPTTGSPTAGANAFGQFYNSGNDGLVLNLTGANAFQLSYKANATVSASDPNSNAGMVALNGAFSGNLTFTPVDISLTVNASTWEVIFYGSAGQTSVNNGTWNLAGFQSTWGNSTDGFGNSSFLMDVQTTGPANVSDPTATVNGSATATLNSVEVTAVPEPSKAIMLLGGIGALFFMRRRK